MRTYLAAVPALLVAIAPWSGAQNPPPPATEVGADLLALKNLPAAGGAKLTVSSPALKFCN